MAEANPFSRAPCFRGALLNLGLKGRSAWCQGSPHRTQAAIAGQEGVRGESRPGLDSMAFFTVSTRPASGFCSSWSSWDRTADTSFI